MKRVIRFECEGNPDDACGGYVEFKEGRQKELECPHCGTIYMPKALRKKEMRAEINKTFEGAINPRTCFV